MNEQDMELEWTFDLIIRLFFLVGATVGIVSYSSLNQSISKLVSQWMYCMFQNCQTRDRDLKLCMEAVCTVGFHHHMSFYQTTSTMKIIQKQKKVKK